MFQSAYEIQFQTDGSIEKCAVTFHHRRDKFIPSAAISNKHYAESLRVRWVLFACVLVSLMHDGWKLFMNSAHIKSIRRRVFIYLGPNQSVIAMRRRALRNDHLMAANNPNSQYRRVTWWPNWSEAASDVGFSFEICAVLRARSNRWSINPRQCHLLFIYSSLGFIFPLLPYCSHAAAAAAAIATASFEQFMLCENSPKLTSGKSPKFFNR
jgi:hypothetical protein